MSLTPCPLSVTRNWQLATGCPPLVSTPLGGSASSACRRAGLALPSEPRLAHHACVLWMPRIPRVVVAPLRAVDLPRPAVHAERLAAVLARPHRQLEPQPHIDAWIVLPPVSLQSVPQRPLLLPPRPGAFPLARRVVGPPVADVRLPAHPAHRDLLPALEVDLHPHPQGEVRIARNHRDIQRAWPAERLFQFADFALGPPPRLLFPLRGDPCLVVPPPLDLPAPVRAVPAHPSRSGLNQRLEADMAGFGSVRRFPVPHADIIERAFCAVNGSFDQFAAK